MSKPGIPQTRFVEPEYRDTHSHSAGNLHAGTHSDKLDRPDAGMGAGGIGKAFKAFGAFTPMIQTAPIIQLTHHHYTIPCPSCGAGILWDGSPVSFLCQGCGATVDGKALSGQ
jgi:hypothetical protein